MNSCISIQIWMAHSNKQSMQIYLGCKQIKSRQTSIEAKPIIVIISVIMRIQYSRNSNLTELQQCSKHRQHSKMSYLSDDSIISLLIFYHHVCICQWLIGIHSTWHGICLHRLTVCTMFGRCAGYVNRLKRAYHSLNGSSYVNW